MNDFAGAGAGFGATTTGFGAGFTTGAGFKAGVGTGFVMGGGDVVGDSLGVDELGSMLEDTGARNVMVTVASGASAEPGRGLSLTTVQPAQLSGSRLPSSVTIFTVSPAAANFLDAVNPAEPV